MPRSDRAALIVPGSGLVAIRYDAERSAQPRRAGDARMQDRRAPGVGCSALILPLKPFCFFGSIGAKTGGECKSTPRVITINGRQWRPSTMKYYTYEVLHLHDRIQLRNRSTRAADVRLRYGSPGQEAGSHQCQRQ